MIKNKYEIIGDKVIIYYTNRKKEKFEILVSLDKFEEKLLNFPVCWHCTWRKDIEGYYVGCTEYLGIVNGRPRYKTILLHRYLMDAQKSDYVDHIDYDGLNNLNENLRLTSNDRNNQNRKSKNKNNTSGYRNVSWIESYKKWCVQLQINGKNTLLGKFDDVHEAGNFAEEMREKYYGEFAGND